MSSCDWFSWFTRTSRSSFINSNDAEFVSTTFMQILNCEGSIWRWITIRLHPFTATLTFLNNVASNGLATSIGWRNPGKSACIWCVSQNLWLAWRIWRIEWAFRRDGFSFERLRNTINCFSSYTEDISLAFG